MRINEVGNVVVKRTEDNGVGVTHFEEYHPEVGDPWVRGLFKVPNVYGSEPNNVMTFGWNFNPNGGRINNGDRTAIGWSFEQNYSPNETTSLMEAHLAFVDKEGIQRRPISSTMHRTNGEISTAFEAHRWDICRVLGLPPSVTVYTSPGGAGHARLGYPGSGFYITVASLEGGGFLRSDAHGTVIKHAPLTVTGCKEGNAALGSLLTKLAEMGLIVDETD